MTEAAARPRADAGVGGWPLVSVVLPTRGRPELVREAIAAVVGQDYPGEVECIVVHDREPADTDLVAFGAPGRTVTVTVNARTAGLPGARNTGLDLARGELVASCDDDDVWHAGKLTAQVRRLLDEPDLLAVGSGLRLLLAGGKVAEWRGRAERVDPDLLLRNRVKELHSSTLVMRREAFDLAGRYDERLPNGYAEDYDWVLTASRVGPIGVVPTPLADIRKDGRSWYSDRAEDTATALEYFLAKHPEIATSRPGHARMLGQIAFARSAQGRRRLAVRLALRALVRWPASPHPYIALAHVVTRVDPARVQRIARRLGRGTA